MQYALALAALAAVATAMPHYGVYEPPKNSTSTTKYTTSTVYSTEIHTITDCGPEVPDCPAHGTKVVTKTVPAYTTVCPVTETEVPPVYTSVPAPSSVSVPVYPSATNTPVAPGTTHSVPVYTPPVASSPPAPVYPSGTVGTPAPSAPPAPTYPANPPIATGGAFKVGGSVAGGLALVAAAFAL